ncbi:DMT family transporter [Oceanirhabdus sp. W0125-5]|uniref:DMT family transporter n=1 Tax=Oceanirhabdus sp. W0125-5 TaxID=2999116 RepID=UPI0022F3214B|nr:EamA family transporter [Oceanirhabdus sp. W0125-5]WBW97228.1 EamA family transporter [Oceanirhabdus sp. W0125-5]
MKLQKNAQSYLLIILGATLWGIISIFVKGLYNLGFNALEVVFIRVFSASLILIVYIIFTNKDLLKINFKDIFYFIGTGVFSIVFFNWCYFTAMNLIPLSVASILLYTAPAFVTILSAIVFKERITKRKVLSLLLTFIGCIFVTGYFPNTGGKITLLGLLVGIGSGFGYALYSIFGKAAMKKYDSITITVYSFIVASISLIPLINLKNMVSLFDNVQAYGYAIALGLFPTVLAFISYTKGLENIESSKASIIATIEPVVASIIGMVVFKQVLSFYQILGILIVIMAIFIVSEKNKNHKKKARHRALKTNV